MSRITWLQGRSRLISSALLALLFALASTSLAFAHERIIRISSDPYTNSSSQHKTQVEPDVYSFGSIVVSTFQSGRFFDGGASNIGWATSHNGGATWTHGFLPGTTVYATPPGPYPRVSDPSVAYDPKHGVWIISLLGIVNPSTGPVDVIASRSTDGGLTWSNPVVVNNSGDFNDKNWTTCDTWKSSPFYGNCYTEFDDPSRNNLVQMSTSTDGGLTWGPAKTTADHALVIGGQPVVQPNGDVIVPITVFKNHFNVANVSAFRSTDGGKSWSKTIKITAFDIFGEPSNIRNGLGLVSAQVDASGTVYVVWADCRFENNCSANDIVMTTSKDGIAWSPVQLIPIDPVGSGVDHFLPGIGVRRFQGQAHLGLVYYYYPNANCSTDTCVLDIGFISSENGGSSWSQAERLAGPFKLTWLAITNQGYMAGDYMATTIVPDDDAVPVFMVAQKPDTGTKCTTGVVCHEATYTTPEDALLIKGGTITSQATPIDSGLSAPRWHTAN